MLGQGDVSHQLAIPRDRYRDVAGILDRRRSGSRDCRVARHNAGASPKAIQSILGHGSAAFSLTVYGHLFDADLDDLADRLDGPRTSHGPALDVVGDPAGLK